MDVLINLIQRKDNPISQEEASALVALRKEYMRKNIELNDLGKQLDKQDKQLWELEKENDKITNDAIKWYKDKQKLIQLYNKLKRQMEYLNNRASIAEENLLVNQL